MPNGVFERRIKTDDERRQIVEARFWSRIDKSGPTMPGMTTPCWAWTGFLTHDGYGRMFFGKKPSVLTHRFAYELCVGPCPPRPLEPDHLCRNRACANPDHIEFVTKRENQMRGIGFVPINAAKTHCKHGHEYDEKNTIRRARHLDRRECRECGRQAQRRYQDKKRGIVI